MAHRPWRDRAIVQLTLHRIREFLREPEAVFWTFLFPIALAGGLAIAFRNRPPEAVPIGVVMGTPGSERALLALRNARGLVIDALDDSAAAQSLRTGKVALLVVPRGDSGVDYRYDNARAEARLSRLLADAALQRAAGRADPLVATESQIAEPGSRYIDFFLPGLLGMNLMGGGIWPIAFGIVTARGKKLLKRLTATPMSRAQYLLSFLLSRLIFLVIEVAFILGVGRWVFGVPMRGSLATVLIITTVAGFAFSGLGLLIATRARTVEAASGMANLVMVPMWIFSGVFFASARFPDLAQPFIKALPLTAAVDALRAVMLQGATLASVGGELAIIAAWMIGSFLLALKLFRWR